MTPTIADHSTHCLFTAEALCTSPRRSLIECYNSSAMSQAAIQALTTAAAASAAASLAATEAVLLRSASSRSLKVDLSR